MTISRRSHRALLFAAGAVLYGSGEVHAGGFYVPQKGATGIGLASAGDAARASDAATVFFNPAGMVLLPGTQVEIGIDLLRPIVRIADTGSTAATPGTQNAPMPYGGANANAGTLTPVPNMYGVRAVSDELWIGLAVTAPFGLGLRYASDWFGRYDSIRSELLTLDAAPSLAWRVDPAWSIGAGLDVQFADAELTNALPDTLNPGGPTPATDGLARLKADGWAAGFNLGAHYHPSDATRIGIAYRSGIRHKLKGTATVQGLGGALAAANGAVGATSRFRLPPIATLSLAQRAATDWTLLVELQWFGWRDFDSVRAGFADGRPDSVRAQRFHNTHSLAVGTEYRAGEHWTLRGGVRIENTPTGALRNSSIPDSDLRWIGAGATWRASERRTLDFGFVHAAFKAADIDLQLPQYAGTPLAGSIDVKGHISRSAVNTLSLSLRQAF